MTETQIEVGRLVGKIVLFSALCWLVVLISGVVGALQGVLFEPLNVVLAIAPGIAFVPAASYAVRLHRESSAHLVVALWRKAALLGIAGSVMLIGAAYVI